MLQQLLKTQSDAPGCLSYSIQLQSTGSWPSWIAGDSLCCTDLSTSGPSQKTSQKTQDAFLSGTGLGPTTMIVIVSLQVQSSSVVAESNLSELEPQKTKLTFKAL